MADSVTSLTNSPAARDVGVISMLQHHREDQRSTGPAYAESANDVLLGPNPAPRKLAVMRPTYVAETMRAGHYRTFGRGINYRERLTSTDIPRSRKAMLAEGEFTEDDLLADCL